MPRQIGRVAAIDPGKSGAVAVFTREPRVVTYNCPQEEMELIALLRQLGITTVILENVGQARAGNGLVSAVRFAQHCQMLRSTLKVAGYKVELVAPSKWIPAFLGEDKVPFPMDAYAFSKLPPAEKKRVESAHKRARKKKIQNKVLTKYGNSVSLNHADAAALLLYYKETQT